MNHYDVSLLDLVEFYGELNGLIASESELSDHFDEIVLSNVVEHYGEDDKIALQEAFNNYTDALCTDGLLHAEQYKNYSYIGRLS